MVQGRLLATAATSSEGPESCLNTSNHIGVPWNLLTTRATVFDGQRNRPGEGRETDSNRGNSAEGVSKPVNNKSNPAGGAMNAVNNRSNRAAGVYAVKNKSNSAGGQKEHDWRGQRGCLQQEKQCWRGQRGY